MKKTIFIAVVSLIIYGCGETENKNANQENPEEFMVGDRMYVIDTLALLPEDHSFIENFSPNQLYEEFSLAMATDSLKANKMAALDRDDCGNIPTNLAALDGGIERYVLKYNRSAGVNLEIFGHKGGLERKDVLIVSDFVQRKKIVCSSSETRTYGVGVRLVIHVKNRKKSINLSLPKLAANVELERARASFKLTTIGITGPKIIDLLPSSDSFDVENYKEVMNAVDSIIGVIKDDQEGVIIKPTLLPNLN
ncbi:hypothetical protein [Spongiimicrobium sp. 3-5]|uniref:hypothetical protein n=1 Tax=Spongiimicrobium sp. 3-5 TaxID=3332596 RepID=UPI0039804EA1